MKKETRVQIWGPLVGAALGIFGGGGIFLLTGHFIFLPVFLAAGTSVGLAIAAAAEKSTGAGG